MLAMLVIAAFGGCTVIRNEFRTLIAEPLKYGDNVDIVRTTKVNKEIAKEAFRQFDAHHAEFPASPDFRDGFIEGFADYLTFGGSGAPPVVPPRRYWNLPDRNPAGQDAVQAWFAGFAAGASEAKLSGLREQQTVPSSYVPVDGDYAAGLEPQGVAPQIDDDWELVPAPGNSRPADQAVPLPEPDPLPPLFPPPPTSHGSFETSRPPHLASVEQSSKQGTGAVNRVAARGTEPIATRGNDSPESPVARVTPRNKNATPSNVLRQSSRRTSSIRLRYVENQNEAAETVPQAKPIEQTRDADSDRPQ